MSTRKTYPSSSQAAKAKARINANETASKKRKRLQPPHVQPVAAEAAGQGLVVHDVKGVFALALSRKAVDELGPEVTEELIEAISSHVFQGVVRTPRHVFFLEMRGVAWSEADLLQRASERAQCRAGSGAPGPLPADDGNEPPGSV